MVVNDIVQWTAQDDAGTFLHTGVLKSVARSTYTLAVPGEGEMMIDKTDGEFAVLISSAENTDAWNSWIKQHDPDSGYVYKQPVIKAVETVKQDKPIKDAKQSKIARAKELYAAAEDTSRKSIIALFVNELAITAANASVYYSKCKATE